MMECQEITTAGLVKQLPSFVQSNTVIGLPTQSMDNDTGTVKPRISYRLVWLIR